MHVAAADRFAVADEVCFLHDGAILERGAPAELLGRRSARRRSASLRRLTDAGRL